MLAMLATLPLLAAASGSKMNVNLCASEAPMVRIFFAQGGYIAPPEVSRLMVDISDGNKKAVDQDVQHMEGSLNSVEAEHWRDLALYTAVTDGRFEIAELLIKRGADVNSRPAYPAFSTYGIAMATSGWQMELRKLNNKRQVTDSEIKAWEPDPPTVPMLEQAAMCSHVATMKVLLTHGADMYKKVGMHESGSKVGILASVIINNNEDSIAVLLDHGYDPCRDFPPDRNLKHQTDVMLARRLGLSAPLLQRITDLSTKCPAPASASSAH